MGIGFIPFDWVTPAGLGNTTAFDPSYFYPVTNVPFGGSLPVMVNFLRAGLDGASFYQVRVDGNLRTDQFNTAKWDGTEYVAGHVRPADAGRQSGLLPRPVRLRPDALRPAAARLLPRLHQLGQRRRPTPSRVEFFDATGTAIESATPLTIYVDNNPCSVSLAQAAIGASSATTDCGYLAYNPSTAATDDVTIAYSAGQPEGFANWSFSLTKAGTSVYSTGGPVTSPPAPFAETVAGLLGTCTVAAFAAYVYVAATANTGWSRCSQYDRSALEAFALAP